MKVIRGKVWKFGDSIDTDVISPGGERETKLAETTMTAIRPEFPKKVKRGDIIVAGRNFGCGSHRESANMILRKVGVEAVLAESIARIFFRVSISIAYPTFVVKGICNLVEDEDEVEINYDQGYVKNIRTGESISFNKYPPSVEEIFDVGGLLPLLRQRYERENQ